MRIKELSVQNFKSFGNNLQTISFDKDGELILLSGNNGSGKCLSKYTEIEISSDDESLMDEIRKFIENRKNPL